MFDTITPDIGHIVLIGIICAMAIKSWVVAWSNRTERDVLTKKIMAQAGTLQMYADGLQELGDALKPEEEADDDPDEDIWPG